MALTIEDIRALDSGMRDPIWVGELPYTVAQALGVKNPNAYLSKGSLDHIRIRHPQEDDYSLLRVPFAIRHGLLIRERVKSSCILASYQDPESSRRFIAAMKLADQDCEVWLSSFYRGKRKQVKRLLLRGDILKKHD